MNDNARHLHPANQNRPWLLVALADTTDGIEGGYVGLEPGTLTPNVTNRRDLALEFGTHQSAKQFGGDIKTDLDRNPQLTNVRVLVTRDENITELTLFDLEDLT
ncbi:MAG: hypothetical protein ACF8PN_08020 [Phycisphaerales bacterium]